MAWNPIQTAADFEQQVILQQTQESTTLDFKANLQRQKPDSGLEFCRDITQFANAWGGTLLIGVSEMETTQHGLKVAKAIDPVTDYDKQKEWMEQQIAKSVHPAELPHSIVSVVLQVGQIIAVNIAPTSQPAWVYDSQTHAMYCVRRTAHGKEYLTPGEAERLAMNTTRSTAILFKEHSAAVGDAVKVVTDFTRASVYSTGSHDLDNEIKLAAISEQYFSLSMQLPSAMRAVGDYVIDVPFAMVLAVWRNNGILHVALTHALSVNEQLRYRFKR